MLCNARNVAFGSLCQVSEFQIRVGTINLALLSIFLAGPSCIMRAVAPPADQCVNYEAHLVLSNPAVSRWWRKTSAFRWALPGKLISGSRIKTQWQTKLPDSKSIILIACEHNELDQWKFMITQTATTAQTFTHQIWQSPLNDLMDEPILASGAACFPQANISMISPTCKYIKNLSQTVAS